MKTKLQKATVFTAVVILISLTGTLIGCSARKAPHQSDSEKAEFQFTKQEQRELGRWKNGSFDRLTDDALDGDPAALFLVGNCFLYGLSGCTIDTKAANAYFAASASLGFPPAIDLVRGMYLENGRGGRNMYLSLVYTNLTASFNHPEYTLPYLEIRDALLEHGGAPLSDKIEIIAARKSDEISANISTLKNLKNKEERRKFIAKLVVTGGITSDDKNFDDDYWLSTFEEKDRS